MDISESLVLITLAVVASCRPSHPRKGCQGNTASAFYFITHDANNSVVVLLVAQDGSLSSSNMVATGRAGVSQVSMIDGTPNGPDALGTQSSIKVVDNVINKNLAPVPIVYLP